MPSELSHVHCLREYLWQLAEQLHTQIPSLPLNIGRLCSRFRISIIYKEGIPRYNAYLATKDAKDWSSAIIFLPYEGGGSNFERFCIAHELAHYLIFRAFGEQFQNPSQFWQVEALCDEFARQLLVPDRVVEKYLGDGTPSSALKSTFALMNFARVPWIQAAKRLSELQERTNFLRIALPAESRAKILASTFPRQKERGRLLDEDTSFATLLRTLSKRQPPWMPYYIDSSSLAEFDVPSLAGALEAAVCFRTSISKTEAYLAVVE